MVDAKAEGPDTVPGVAVEPTATTTTAEAAATGVAVAVADVEGVSEAFR